MKTMAKQKFFSFVPKVLDLLNKYWISKTEKFHVDLSKYQESLFTLSADFSLIKLNSYLVVLAVPAMV